MGISVNVFGYDNVANSLDAMAEAAAQKRITAEAGAVLKREVIATISATDHTQADLTAADHPYARRHGRIRIHTSKPQTVHNQTGTMLRALRTESAEISLFGQKVGVFRIWFDLSAAPHARYVIQGTRKMLARDVLWDTATDRRVEKEMRLVAVRVFGQELRSGARLRFTGVRRGGGRTSRTGT